MLASLVIWVILWEFIKSLQLCYYPRVSYFYLSGVIISIPSQREKLGNRSVSLHLEKDNENQNITRRKNKQPNKKPMFISTFASPYSKACIQILLVWLTLHLEWDHYINIRTCLGSISGPTLKSIETNKITPFCWKILQSLMKCQLRKILLWNWTWFIPRNVTCFFSLRWHITLDFYIIFFTLKHHQTLNCAF